MSTIETLNNGESGSIIRSKINSNFSNLNNDKVEKVTGKGLSTEDYTTSEKNKLAGIEANANNYTLPTATTLVKGGVKIDGTTIIIDGDGVITSVGGGGGVPYTGATGNVDLGNNTLTASTLITNFLMLLDATLSYITPSNLELENSIIDGDINLKTNGTGKVRVNGLNVLDRANHTGTQLSSTISDLNSYTGTLTNKTLDDISNDIGANHIHTKVQNLTGVTIPNGTVVKFVSYTAGEETVRITPTTSTADFGLGVTHGNIAHGATGLIVNTGLATGINTTGYTAGVILYQNGAGGFTETKPTTGTFQACAIAMNSKNDGALLVEFTNPHNDNNLVANARTITINGTTQDLSTDRTFNISDANLVTTDITTNNATASKHGFLPKLENTGTKYLRDDGTWQTVSGGGGGSMFYETNLDGQIYTGTIAQFIATSTQTIAGVHASLLSLPTGSDVTIQVYKNGLASTNSIFTSDTPLTIATTTSATNGVYSVLKTTIDNGSLVAGDVVYISITGIGNVLPGSDFYIRCF